MYSVGMASPSLAPTAPFLAHTAHTLVPPCTHPHITPPPACQCKTPFLVFFPGVIPQVPEMSPFGENDTVSVGKQGVMIEVALGLSGQSKASFQPRGL